MSIRAGPTAFGPTGTRQRRGNPPAAVRTATAFIRLALAPSGPVFFDKSAYRGPAASAKVVKGSPRHARTRRISADSRGFCRVRSAESDGPISPKSTTLARGQASGLFSMVCECGGRGCRRAPDEWTHELARDRKTLVLAADADAPLMNGHASSGIMYSRGRAPRMPTRP